MVFSNIYPIICNKRDQLGDIEIHTWFFRVIQGLGKYNKRNA